MRMGSPRIRSATWLGLMAVPTIRWMSSASEDGGQGGCGVVVAGKIVARSGVAHDFNGLAECQDPSVTRSLPGEGP